MLKGQRTFYARVFCGEISFDTFFSEIRSWLETTTEDYLLERLDNSPVNKRPIVQVSNRIHLDFNTVEEEVVSGLSSQYLS